MELLLEGKPNDSELCSILNKLILSWESEVVEFKEAMKLILKDFSMAGWCSVLEIRIK